MHSCCSGLSRRTASSSAASRSRSMHLRLDAVVARPIGVEHVGGAHLELEPAGLHVVGHQVAGDGGEPGADVLAGVGERVDPAQGAQERLGRQVLGQRVGAHPVVEVAVDLVDVPVVDEPEGLGVALLGQRDQGVDAVPLRVVRPGRPPSWAPPPGAGTVPVPPAVAIASTSPRRSGSATGASNARTASPFVAAAGVTRRPTRTRDVTNVSGGYPTVTGVGAAGAKSARTAQRDLRRAEAAAQRAGQGARGRGRGHADLHRLAAGAVVPDPPAVLAGVRPQPGVRVDRARVPDQGQHRDVVGRVGVRRAGAEVEALAARPAP